MNTTVGINRIDVLCVGSSHAFQSIIPAQMYAEKGYSSYVLAGGSRAPWQDYYYIKEALKDQSPKLIVLDVYKAGGSQAVEAYHDYETVNNLLETPLSINKIRAVAVSRADSKLDILLRFPYIHDKFSGFPRPTIDKFYGNRNTLFGYDLQTDVEPGSIPQSVRGVTGTAPINSKNEKYLRKIIEYSQKNGINILLANTPWPQIDEEGQMYFNYIGKLAKEYNVPFLDGNLYWDEIGIDWSTDRNDKHGHLNYSGATKYTHWLDEYISEHYDIADHRNDPEYSVYEDGIRWIEEILAQE